eukprot:937569-Alexandrium_andersonii.AAC.1
MGNRVACALWLEPVDAHVLDVRVRVCACGTLARVRVCVCVPCAHVRVLAHMLARLPARVCRHGFV